MTDIAPDIKPGFKWSSVRGMVLKSIVGSVVLAAAIAIFAIIVGTFGLLEGKLLTVVLLFVFFALGCLFDAAVVSPRNELFAFVGIFVNVYLLLAGVFKILFAGTWPGETETPIAVYNAFWIWVLLVLFARAALGYAMLVAAERRVYRYNSLESLIAGTMGALALLTLFVSIPFIAEHPTHFPDWYWRLTAVLAVLTILGTVLIPLVGRLFGERLAPVINTAATDEGAVPRLKWPALEDGTPLPAREDGSPDYSIVRPKFHGSDEDHKV